MGVRSSLVAGLLAGTAAAVVLIAGVVAFVPEAAAPSSSPAPHPLPAGTATPAPSSAAPTTVASVSPEPSTITQGPFHVGEPAPALVVPQVGGGTIDLAALRGKPVWVNFMATWCPSCQEEFPQMSSFAARYADEGLVVLAIDVEEEEGTVAAFGQQLGATFPLGLDGDGHVADAWDAIALPVHFWVDADGVVRDGALGGIGPDIMAAGLQSIMPGVDVRP